MLTFIRYWYFRLTRQTRRAGGVLAARSRRLNRQAAIDAQPQQAQP